MTRSPAPSAPHAAGGVVDLTPFEFLDRLADLVPPPRKHRHRYHGVFGPRCGGDIRLRGDGRQEPAPAK
jgi:hypothetical protein